ncbi:substrate-binding domain-containing protein [Chloroflexi bacterium TSY]|nr:substrate-binding domain-containing protein [Chloroflexi bacterium TSY]
MSQTQKTTIQDIADKANVSISTVSRVLNGNTPVATSKKDAVLAAVAELNYQPNIFAQGLARGQSMTVGVLTQNVSGPIYDAILRGVLQGLEGSNYSPLFADGRWQETQEEKAIQLLMSRRIDGLIVLGGSTPELRLQQIAQEMPLVVVARRLSSLPDQCLAVDDFQGAYRATQYLIEMGHRDIAHITGIQAHQDAEARRQGHQQALVDAGLEPHTDLVIEGNFLEQSGVMAVEMLLSRSRTFSAIFAANDQMAHGARLALFRRGLRVPDDVSLIGFDDQHSAAYMIPPLTTVRFPASELGEAAAKAILQRLAGQPHAVPTFPLELVLRESVARCG